MSREVSGAWEGEGRQPGNVGGGVKSATTGVTAGDSHREILAGREGAGASTPGTQRLVVEGPLDRG